MSAGKKITAFITSLAVVLSATGCGTGKDTAWSARYNDYETAAGIFIYYEMNAYYEALNKAAGENSELDTTDKNALKAVQIDGKDMLTWIQDEATENLRKYLAVQSEFDNRGLMISIEDVNEMNESVDSAWEYYSDYYEMNGIGKESFRKISELSYKSAELFESYYGTGGTNEVPAEEIVEYYDENYARTKYIAMELNDAEGNALDDEGKAEVKEMAEDYIERINSGEDFDDILEEYNEYLAGLQAEAEEETAESEETAETTESSAEESAESSAEETAEVTGDISEEEVTVTEAEAENSENIETVEQDDSSDVTEAEESAETDTAETEESDETGTAETEPAESETESEENADTAEESAESDDSSTETTDEYANENIIKKGSDEISYTPSEIVNNAIFEQETLGEAFFIDDTDNNIYYVAVRYDITERTDLFEDDYLITVLNEMKGEDYDAELLSIVTDENIILNEKAYKRYNPFDFEV